MLGVNGAGDSKGRVELFERGYGKDAAGIAKEAINYGSSQLVSCFAPSCSQLSAFIGRDNDFDVVLIDTAGRMQDNEVRLPCAEAIESIAYSSLPSTQPLMRALAKVSKR